MNKQQFIEMQKAFVIVICTNNTIKKFKVVKASFADPGLDPDPVGFGLFFYRILIWILAL
jgi:hypothetical protein